MLTIYMKIHISMRRDWNYAGIFLEKSTQDNLLRKLSKFIPDGWKTYCHHETLIYNDGSPEAETFFQKVIIPLDKEPVDIDVIGIGTSDRAIALWVDATIKPLVNKVAHITVAVAPGAKPVESNYIKKWKRLKTPFKIKGNIGWIPKKNA